MGTVHERETDQGMQRVLEPDSTPLIDQVIAWLDAQPAPPPRIERVRHGEAHLVAATVCVRWSSYLAFLADVQRPAWLVARRATSLNLSRISNAEMWCINLEITHAYASWLALEQVDPERFASLADKARHYLTNVRPVPMLAGYHGVSGMFGLHIAPPAGWERQPVRALANALMLHAWRNGAIEAYHAGRSTPLPLQQRRITPAQARQLVGGAASCLAAIWSMIDERIAPPTQSLAGRAKLVLAQCYSPVDWSIEDTTHTVVLDGAEPGRSTHGHLVL